jgi:hypothetical protein
MKRLLRLKPMAEELQLAERTLRGMLPEGIPHIKYKGTIWFDTEKVLAWLSKFERTGKPPKKAARKRQELAEAAAK